MGCYSNRKKETIRIRDLITAVTDSSANKAIKIVFRKKNEIPYQTTAIKQRIKIVFRKKNESLARLLR